MKIEALQSQNYKRHRHPKGCYFQDLPAWAREDARQLLDRFLFRARRRAGGLPLEPWLVPILVGRAKWLALHPLDSQWGRSMRARKAGLAAQRKYRAEGRNPLADFNHKRQIMESAQGPEKAVSKSKLPGQEVIFSRATILIYGKASGSIRGRTPADLAKQVAGPVAEQVTYKLSSDDRFGLNAGPQPSRWDFQIEYQIFATPVS
jgi:hypothetical protein